MGGIMRIAKHSLPIGDHPLWPCQLRVIYNFVRRSYAHKQPFKETEHVDVGISSVFRGGNRSGSRCPVSLLATCASFGINGEKDTYQRGKEITSTRHGYL